MDRKKALALSCAVILAACATTGRTNHLRIGMSKQEAISVMGAPRSTSASDSVEYLDYSLTDGFLGSHRPYYIALRNNKVSEFGERADARVPCPRPPR